MDPRSDDVSDVPSGLMDPITKVTRTNASFVTATCNDRGMARYERWFDGELVGFDLETTGVDRFSDVPVSYALVKFEAGVVVDRDVSLVDPGRKIPPGASAVHGITSERAIAEGIPLVDALRHLGEEIAAAGRRGAPIVGMNIAYDLTMLDVQLKKRCGGGLESLGWSGPAIDVLTLDRHFEKFRKGSRRLGDLCEVYGVTLEDAHDASADAQAAVQIAIAQSARHVELRSSSPVDLHSCQARWHREWAESYDSWRKAHGRSPMNKGEFRWPAASFVDSMVEAASG